MLINTDLLTFVGFILTAVRSLALDTYTDRPTYYDVMGFNEEFDNDKSKISS